MAPNPSMLASKFTRVAAVVGMLFLAINPPFAVNDEDVHIARIYELSTGRLVTRADADGDYHLVPSDYLDASNRYQGIGQRKSGRVHAKKVIRDLSAPRPELPLVRMTARAGAYLPLAYHLQLPVVWLARQLNVSVFWHLYLARLASLAVYVFIARSAVRTAPVGLQWLFFALGLIPMAVTQAAGVSSDGLVIGLSLLYFALIAKGSLGPGTPSRREYAVLGSCLLVVTLCKPVYILLGMCLPLVELHSPRSLARRLLPSAALTLGTLLLFLVLSRTTNNPDAPPDMSHSVSGQLTLLINDPRLAFTLVRQTIWRQADDLLVQTLFVRHILSDSARFAGAVGGLTYLQLLLILAWGASRAASKLAPPLRRVHIAVLLGCGVAIILAVPSALYLCCNTLGRTSLRGLQGRYLIPAVPALLLGLSYLGRPVLGRWITRRHPTLIVAWIVAVNVFCVFTLIGWHYYSPAVDWPF